MRYKLAVLLGCPASVGLSPERAADEGQVGDLLVESESLAWHLNPQRFPALTAVRPVEVMIDGQIFSLWDAPGSDLSETVTDAQNAELPILGRELADRLGYGAVAVGVMDLDHPTFRRLYWLFHADPRAALKFLACGLDATRSRLVFPLSGGQSLLEPPSSVTLKKACEQDMECSTVLGPLAASFQTIETVGAPEVQALLTEQCASLGASPRFSADGSVEIQISRGCMKSLRLTEARNAPQIQGGSGAPHGAYFGVREYGAERPTPEVGLQGVASVEDFSYTL